MTALSLRNSRALGNRAEKFRLDVSHFYFFTPTPWLYNRKIHAQTVRAVKNPFATGSILAGIPGGGSA